MATRYIQKGFTLIELLVTVAVMAILVTMGAPAILDALKSNTVKGAADGSYYALQYARSVAISKGVDANIDFQDGANWCVGISDAGVCDCSVAASCTVDGVEQRVLAADYRNVTMQNVTFVDQRSVIDSRRGLAIGNAGQLEFTDGTNTLRLVLSNLGRPRICVAAGTVTSYEDC